MVFAGFYPANRSDLDDLNIAIEKLTCNDKLMGWKLNATSLRKLAQN